MELKDLIVLHRDRFTTNPYSVFLHLDVRLYFLRLRQQFYCVAQHYFDTKGHIYCFWCQPEAAALYAHLRMPLVSWLVHPTVPEMIIFPFMYRVFNAFFAFSIITFIYLESSN